MSISAFKNTLSSTVKELTLSEANWKHESWKNSWECINQDCLNDAFAQHATLRALFASVGEMTERQCKHLARVQKKMTEQAPGRENYFKVVGDLVAVRLHCDVSEITKKIDLIREIVLQNGGQFHIRGASEARPYGFCLNADNKFSDITQYAYAYLEQIGYPIELQIGHPFASHTFSIDSALRDDPKCGKVDLWNDNFYVEVKAYLLAKANQESCGDKQALLEKAKKIHAGNVPTELQELLNAL
jgi:hypothetical protein